MSVDCPLVMPYCFREWLVGSPCDNFIVIKGIGHTKYICTGVLCIVISPLRSQIASATGFKIKPKYCHSYRWGTRCVWSHYFRFTQGGAPASAFPRETYARRRRTGSAAGASSAVSAGSASMLTQSIISKTGVKIRPYDLCT